MHCCFFYDEIETNKNKYSVLDIVSFIDLQNIYVQSARRMTIYFKFMGQNDIKEYKKINLLLKN